MKRVDSGLLAKLRDILAPRGGLVGDADGVGDANETMESGDGRGGIHHGIVA